MKPFRFTLEAVSTLRRRQEQKALEKYAASLQAQRRAMDDLTAAELELQKCWEQMRRQLSAGCSAAEAAQARVFEQVLGKRRDECTRAVETAQRRVNADLQAMLHARRQREIVDKCFEKQKARHERDQARNEQKIVDELASRRGNGPLAWKAAENPL